ncbi:MAG: segregation and condensation protein A [Gammaproteobacteria bacterium]
MNAVTDPSTPTGENVPATDAEQPQQQEMPFAVVRGEKLFELPKDLYIPPDALEVFLEAFEGPLDLLLYLIKRQNLDILDIPIAEITKQYMNYVELMSEFRLELAGEYLVMAAMLAEIKSRLLLPRPAAEDGEDDIDPRAELVRRLQEYERYKRAAEDIGELPREERDYWQGHAEVQDKQVVRLQPDVDLKEVLMAFAEVLRRAELFTSHSIEREPLSVRERMSQVLSQLGGENFTPFEGLFIPEEGKQGVVVTFLALLELVKASLIELVQGEPYAPIHVRSRAAA